MEKDYKVLFECEFALFQYFLFVIKYCSGTVYRGLLRHGDLKQQQVKCSTNFTQLEQILIIRCETLCIQNNRQ